MKKFVPFIIIIALFLMFSLEGCQVYDMYPISSQMAAELEKDAPRSPEEALDKIYAEVEILGVAPLTKSVLQERFLVETDSIDEIWGRYADGKYGLSDVYIIRPKEGQSEAARRMLEDVKLARTVEFRSYDIYNALAIAENGIVFESDGYVALLMLEDNETAQTLLEEFFEGTSASSK